MIEPGTECLILARGNRSDRFHPGWIVRLSLGQAQTPRGEEAVQTLKARPSRQVIFVVAAAVERNEPARVGMGEKERVEGIGPGFGV